MDYRPQHDQFQDASRRTVHENFRNNNHNNNESRQRPTTNRGGRTWRGEGGAGQCRPRVRTESWPAIQNGQQTSSSSRAIPIFDPNRYVQQHFSNRRGGCGFRPPHHPSIGRFDHHQHRTPPFSYSGPPPPPILEPPRFYFDMENTNNWSPPPPLGFMNRFPPPPIPNQLRQQQAQVFALNPPPPPMIVRPRQQPLQHQPRSTIINNNIDVRLLENPFNNLKVRESNEKSEPQSLKSPSKIESPPSIPSLLFKRELGMINKSKMRRQVAEIRVREGGRSLSSDDDGSNRATTASTVKKVLEDFPGESLQYCQFMEATPDGKNIFGSWALRDREWTRIMCARVETDGRKAEAGRYGIELRASDNYIYVMDKNVVDMCRARVDNAVTCVLYVTAPTQTPGSRIFLQPVPELSETNDHSRMGTPMYNAHWALNEGVLSCAWDFTRMRCSVGLERYGLILDVVSEKDFKLFSSHKNVLAQKFSKDGSLLYMGVRDSSILCCDLRRQYHHAVYALPQSSTCQLYLMSDENYLIAGDYSGRVNLWDLRTQRILRTFDGQTNNSQTKLPMVVDEQDSLIFAVGDNGTTSGWSLKTGQLLRQIPCPRPIVGDDGQQPHNSHRLPRVCYSGCWGGVAGNAAVVLSVDDEAHFYELQLL